MAPERRSLRGNKFRPRDDPIIAIGIDFGTTYSGVSWARSGQPDLLQAVTNWDSIFPNNADKEKVPTEIAYNNEGHVSSWGYNIQSHQSPLKWFKLLLLNNSDLLPSCLQSSKQIKVAREFLKIAGKQVEEVISDYLRVLWKHSLDNIKRSVGNSMLRASRLSVVFTLPAIWPAYAQDKMRQAIEKAGVLDTREAGATKLTFISEPEAAAISTMADMSDRSDMRKTDRFTVCDAGGGTVDVITYTVVRERTASTSMELKECIKGDGDLCGAVFLDEAFMNLLRSSIPERILSQLDPPSIERLKKTEWEHGIKPQFKNDAMSFSLQLPPTTNNNGLSEIRLQREQIFGVFEPCVSRIEQLVHQQAQEVRRKIRKMPKYIILVGGFGKSRFLHRYLQEAMNDYDIEVLQASGDRPWTAVCRGAVLQALALGCPSNAMPVTVTSRIVRLSYGTTFNALPWDPKDHHARDKVFCPIEQDYLAVDQVRWFVKIGDIVTANDPICHTFWQDLKSPQDELVTDLVFCKEAHPPNRDDFSVQNLCKVKWSKIPNFDQLPTWSNNNGDVFRHVAYDVQMAYNGISFEFSIQYDGEQVASRNVDIDFTGRNDDAPTTRL